MNRLTETLYHHDDISLHEIQEWVRRDPEALSHGDRIGCLPLHVACMNTHMSHGTLLWMINTYPKAASIQDEWYCLPLHYFVLLGHGRKAAASPVLLRLLEVNPEGPKTPNMFEQLPLHTACSRTACPEIIRILVEHYPQACKVKDKNGRLPIHSVRYSPSPSFRDDQHEIIRILVECYPEACKEKDCYGNLPLHSACNTELCDYESIGILVESNPEACKEKDTRGNLPLHCLCAGNLNEDSRQGIELLVDAFPGGLLERNQDGKSPLDCLVVNMRCNFEGIRWFNYIRWFIDKYPETVRSQDETGCLPLHNACRHGADYAIVELLLDRYPEGSRVRNRSGKFPLHFYVAVNNPCIVTMTLLIDQHSEALLAFDSEQLLPLECFWNRSCRSWRTKWEDVFESFQFLLNESDEALRQKDSLGRLSLHRLCRIKDVPLEALQATVNAYPESAKVSDRLGNVPLFYFLREILSC